VARTDTRVAVGSPWKLCGKASTRGAFSPARYRSQASEAAATPRQHRRDDAAHLLAAGLGQQHSDGELLRRGLDAVLGEVVAAAWAAATRPA
jgi:hypothetical protein